MRAILAPLISALFAVQAWADPALTTIPATRMYPIAGSSCTLTTASIGATTMPAWSCSLGSKLAFSLPLNNNAAVIPHLSVVTRPSALAASAMQYCVILSPHIYGGSKIFDSAGSNIQKDTWTTFSFASVDLVAADDVSVPTSGSLPLFYSSHNLYNYSTGMLDISGSSASPSIGSQLSMAVGIYGCSSYCSASPIKPSCCSGTCTNYNNNVLVLGVNYIGH